MDREAWWATVHGVAMSQTRLNDFTSHFLTKEVIEYYFLGTYLNQVPRSPLITFLILPSQNWNLNIGKIMEELLT